jgi:hypothetical protein
MAHQDDVLVAAPDDAQVDAQAAPDDAQAAPDDAQVVPDDVQADADTHVGVKRVEVRITQHLERRQDY